MNTEPRFRPISSLLSDALTTASELAQSEAKLARAEMMAGLRRATFGLALCAIAVALLAIALNLMAGSAVAVLVEADLGIGPAAAAAIVAGGAALLAALLAFAGKRALSDATLTPRRTAENLRRDARMLTEALTDD